MGIGGRGMGLGWSLAVIIGFTGGAMGFGSAFGSSTVRFGGEGVGARTNFDRRGRLTVGGATRVILTGSCLALLFGPRSEDGGAVRSHRTRATTRIWAHVPTPKLTRQRCRSSRETSRRSNRGAASHTLALIPLSSPTPLKNLASDSCKLAPLGVQMRPILLPLQGQKSSLWACLPIFGCPLFPNSNLQHPDAAIVGAGIVPKSQGMPASNCEFWPEKIKSNQPLE